VLIDFSQTMNHIVSLARFLIDIGLEMVFYSFTYFAPHPARNKVASRGNSGPKGRHPTTPGQPAERTPKAKESTAATCSQWM